MLGKGQHDSADCVMLGRSQARGCWRRAWRGESRTDSGIRRKRYERQRRSRNMPLQCARTPPSRGLGHPSTTPPH